MSGKITYTLQRDYDITEGKARKIIRKQIVMANMPLNKWVTAKGIEGEMHARVKMSSRRIAPLLRGVKNIEIKQQYLTIHGRKKNTYLYRKIKELDVNDLIGKWKRVKRIEKTQGRRNK